MPSGAAQACPGGASWAVLGASWAVLGASWAALGGVLGRLGRILRASEGPLEASEGVVGREVDVTQGISMFGSTPKLEIIHRRAHRGGPERTEMGISCGRGAFV